MSPTNPRVPRELEAALFHLWLCSDGAQGTRLTHQSPAVAYMLPYQGFQTRRNHG
ncbi:MAG: hypothetical protein BWY17_03857 [Deltaproteobacteria bacterium ADurb.Bin207]|nr:MAG: hypothetical protein BWY17_03857 [Deltaproteobacteria bacterium ADurb.Bin207]